MVRKLIWIAELAATNEDYYCNGNLVIKLLV